MTDDETWVDADHANTLNQFDAGDVRTTHAVIQSDSYWVEDCENAALRANGANDGPPRTDKQPLITQAYSIREDAKADTFSATEIDAARCLQKHQPSVQSHHAQTFIAETYPINDGRDIHKDMNGTGIGEDGAPAYTLDRQQHASVVQTFSVYPEGGNGADIAAAKVECSPSLTKVKSERGIHVAERMTVRRLTPVECERLMGWPDGFTAPDGVKAPDSKRYAACGDGIVAPVAFWIADRIRMIEEEGETK